jgi:hypothetical protein
LSCPDRSSPQAVYRNLIATAIDKAQRDKQYDNGRDAADNPIPVEAA